MENSMAVPQKPKYSCMWPSIPILGIYPNNLKTFIYEDVCTPMCVAALFAVAKTRRQPMCPSIMDGIKKMWCMYTMETLMSHKNSWNTAICNHMDGPWEYYAVQYISEKAKNHMISLFCEI